MLNSFDNILLSIYDSSNEKCIYNIILLRKLLIELLNIDKYKDNIIGSIAALTNAVYSKNIQMIEQEVQQLENKFLTNNINFIVHPLVYIRAINGYGDEHMELFRKLLYHCLKANIGGDRYVVKHLDIWLLTANKNTYREAATDVYNIMV